MPPSTHRTPLPAQAAEYVARRPQDTVLHRLVREHYETFVAHTEATYAAPLPRYVTDAFERYRGCGVFSQGFVRCHCDTCRHDVLVAFSCKQRGLCPSCGARRMCDVAANVTEAILPSAPVRQWVLSLPFELRGLAATKPDVLTALGRIFAEEVAGATKRLAGVAGAETGAVSFPQRFGSSLNLHVHFHLLAVDAVFDKHGDGVRMHEAPPPAKADVAGVAQRVHDRALVWLRRHRTSTSAPPRTAATSPRPTRPSTPSRASRSGAARSWAGPSRPPSAPATMTWTARSRASRRRATASMDTERCASRPATTSGESASCATAPAHPSRFALERIEPTKDGRVAYRLKAPRRGKTHRVMTPVEFLGRLAILIPPPYFPLVRYHGAFAARSSWRALVTPKPRDGVTRRKRKPKECLP